jgi:hypothetical protein
VVPHRPRALADWFRENHKAAVLRHSNSELRSGPVLLGRGDQLLDPLLCGGACHGDLLITPVAKTIKRNLLMNQTFKDGKAMVA